MDSVEQITLSSGVVLNLWRGSPLAIDNVVQHENQTNPAPKPPMVHSESKDREEPNENDPDYKAAIMLWNARLGMRIYTILLATSSGVKSIPEGMMPHDSDDFTEVMELSGITPRRTSTGRYVQWIQMIAAKKEDNDLLGTRLLRLAGISEADIAEAEATFRSLQESDADPDALGRVNSIDGNRVPSPNPRVGV